MRAHVPAAELIRYPIDLRSATHGTGIVHPRRYAHHEPMAEDHRPARVDPERA